MTPEQLVLDRSPAHQFRHGTGLQRVSSRKGVWNLREFFQTLLVRRAHRGEDGRPKVTEAQRRLEGKGGGLFRELGIGPGWASKGKRIPVPGSIVLGTSCANEPASDVGSDAKAKRQRAVRNSAVYVLGLYRQRCQRGCTGGEILLEYSRPLPGTLLFPEWSGHRGRPRS